MRRQSRHKICRRVGAPVCGRPTCPALDRPYPAGAQGRGRRSRPTEYQIRLLEKQKLRAMYGVRERQFRRLYQEAARREGPTGENLLRLLELRLDNLVRRLGFAFSTPQARQLVTHGHVLVDGEKLDRPSYLVRPGQTIEVRDELLPVREAMAATSDVPAYLERNEEEPRGRLVREPGRWEIPHPVPVDERLVVEHYAG